MKNRDIKFRVWDTVTKKYVDFAHGHIFARNCIEYATYYLDETGLLNEGNRRIFEQFTGLVDKNGKEIYEGDILRVLVGRDDDIYEHIEIEPIKSFYEPSPLGDLEDFEVVGNIHENPEFAS